MPVPRIDAAKLTLVRQPFDHPDFLFELKYDGFRALAYISEDAANWFRGNVIRTKAS
jgi:ATP-dependent DNA ligase